MRDITYRAKKAYNGEWVEGNLVWTKNWKDAPYECFIISHLAYLEYGEFDDLYKVTPETVGQYVGLTDKNGKKIFEGDIVRFGKNIYQIIFSVGSFALYDEQGEMISKIGGHNDHCYSFMDLYIECCWEDGWAYDVEIIGNVHDNPELLEVK